MEDALNMWEIIAVKRSNEYLASKYRENQK